MKPYIRAWGLWAGAISLTALFGCGGGGGGAPPADVLGRVLFVSSGAAPNPAATVSIAGRSTQTDAQGFFALRGVSSAAKTVTVTAQGAKVLTQNLPTLTPNANNDLGDLFIVASDSDYTANVTGTVVNAEDLQPVANATVRLSGQVTTTNAQGQFSMTGLPIGLGTGGAQVGLVSATNFEDKKLFFGFPLEAGANPLGNILINPPVGPIPGGPTNIRGTITLQGRTDFSGVKVTLLNNAGQQVSQQTTATNGAYGFWVAAGAYTVRAEATGFQTRTQAVNLPRPDQPQTVNLTLTPTP